MILYRKDSTLLAAIRDLCRYFRKKRNSKSFCFEIGFGTIHIHTDAMKGLFKLVEEIEVVLALPTVDVYLLFHGSKNTIFDLFFDNFELGFEIKYL